MAEYPVGTLLSCTHDCGCSVRVESECHCAGAGEAYRCTCGCDMVVVDNGA